MLLDRFSNENVINDDYKFSDDQYKSVPVGNHMWYMEMINRLPDQDSPEMYGLNAIITNDVEESNYYIHILHLLGGTCD